MISAISRSAQASIEQFDLLKLGRERVEIGALGGEEALDILQISGRGGVELLDLRVGQAERLEVGFIVRLLAAGGIPFLYGHVPHSAVLVGDAVVVVGHVVDWLERGLE